MEQIIVGFELSAKGAENIGMEHSSLIIESKAVEPFMKNAYVLGCAKTREAAYIDPGDEVDLMLDWLKQSDLQLTKILLTHAHVDHISGVGKLRNQFELPIYLHPEDRSLYEALPEQGEWFGSRQRAAPSFDEEFVDGQRISVGELELDVLHTPGHSPGSVSLYVEGHLFCGDLIFAGSVGRTDLPGGSHQVLLTSIVEKVFSLDSETILHSGHGPDTTLVQELKTNPFLKGLQKD